MTFKEEQLDRNILQALRNQNEVNWAVRELYRHFSGPVSSFIQSNGGSQQDADDIFQETVLSFIEVVRKDRYRSESSLKTFLLSISKHLWLNQIKKERNLASRGRIYESDRSHVEVDIGQLISEREVKTKLRNLVLSLDEKCRKILILFYYDSLSIKEILKHVPYENEQVVRNRKQKCMQHLTNLIRLQPSEMADSFSKKII